MPSSPPPESMPPSSPPEFNQMSAPRSQDLVQRRQQLKAQRKVKFYTMTWRTFLMTLFLMGTVRLATSPIWQIRSADQIAVSGNQLLSDEDIQAALPVPYPQALLKVQPDELAESLQQYPPIQDAVVSRRLLPPGLHVKINERQPVAVVTPNTSEPVQTISDRPEPFAEPGLIDAQGYWMPRNSYVELGAIASPPTLQVTGMQPGYEATWATIYKQIAQSPVSITGLDWTSASNLILQSELGMVHLGPYSKDFAKQITALDQLRSLNQEINPEQVTFIDLRDPAQPIIEILQATNDTPNVQ